MAKRDLQVIFRMPAVLKKALEVEAMRSGRSLSAEIVLRLQNSLVPSEEVVVIDAGSINLRDAVKQAFRDSKPSTLLFSERLPLTPHGRTTER